MEDHRHGKSEPLAPTAPSFRIYGSPSQFRRESTEARRVESRPVIEIELTQPDRNATSSRQQHEPGEPTRQYQAGDFLTCEYTIDVPAACAAAVQAFEASVIWRTSGKGDEDIGVHFFERRLTKSLPDRFLKRPQRLSTVLPMTPLSYAGRIVKIQWCVRVRLFLDDNTQVTQDEPFRLGHASQCEQPDAAE